MWFYYVGFVRYVNINYLLINVWCLFMLVHQMRHSQLLRSRIKKMLGKFSNLILNAVPGLKISVFFIFWQTTKNYFWNRQSEIGKSTKLVGDERSEPLCVKNMSALSIVRTSMFLNFWKVCILQTPMRKRNNNTTDLCFMILFRDYTLVPIPYIWSFSMLTLMHFHFLKI